MRNSILDFFAIVISSDLKRTIYVSLPESCHTDYFPIEKGEALLIFSFQISNGSLDFFIITSIFILIKKFFITIVSFIASPFAWWWLRRNEKIALRLGRKLNEEELRWAEQLEILYPHKIRVLNVARIPSPVPNWIENFMQRRGYPVGSAVGMCMRYGIYIVEKHSNNKALLAHEIVHTHQFERLGGFWHFLRQYLYEMLLLGYRNAPLENEADAKARQVMA